MIWRYEYKIPCPARLLPEIVIWARTHPAHWRVSYPPRQVNNIYFDTFDMHDLKSNLNGIAWREKLRLRWYGSSIKTVSHSQLELKCKQGLLGCKDVVPFKGELHLVHDSWSEILGQLKAGLPDHRDLWLTQRTVPTLINCYQRVYYETPDGHVRMTLDTNLQAYDQRYSTLPNLTRRSHISEQMVIELKGPEGVTTERRLKNILTTLTLRIDRFSKYLQGILSEGDFQGMSA